MYLPNAYQICCPWSRSGHNLRLPDESSSPRPAFPRAIPPLWSKGGRGVTPYPPPFIFSRGDHPPPLVCVQVGGTPSPLCRPGRGSPPSSKMMTFPNLLSPSWFHAKQGSGSCKNLCHNRMRGEGGDPPPPHLHFFKRGSPPLTYLRAGGGYPPPLCRPGRGSPPSTVEWERVGFMRYLKEQKE
jgi:hypothetical protein